MKLHRDLYYNNEANKREENSKCFPPSLIIIPQLYYRYTFPVNLLFIYSSVIIPSSLLASFTASAASLE